ncbi:fumarylacetoacetate (FAA) hydrolase [Monaibacterium marinum]|uniref:Fumarylacetoacetate (FAA) hydrolase n=1 Tax=Pontivivens marinum TaxID=1690039 RepID=A0A2C9CV10_9RHOB|nr:fumarylacetoacetate hydrolase family protein [Monaibacterium marinum]SOH95112.1 fumarylacetoacetate (FAA) hydrolase [Monaibacterium marinum]
MKLATLDDDSRDGRLVVVSNDLTRCTDARRIAPTLQAALDEWPRLAPELAALARALESGSVPVERFHERDTLSPLPRAYQFLDGSAYINHVELVRKARGAQMPPSFYSDPLMYQGGSDSFLPPRGAIPSHPDWGTDFEGEIAVIVDDVPMGTDAETARGLIALVVLLNDVSLREKIQPELAKGFGFVQSKPACACSPVAVTPDALVQWEQGKLSGALEVDLNGVPFGRADAGQDMTFDFGTLIAHASETRALVAGTVIGSGTVSNKLNGGPGKTVAENGAGYSCIAELRMIETINEGSASTPWLGDGDVVRIDMRDESGYSIFGAIEQTVVEL